MSSYKAAEEQRRADLRSESRSIASYLFVAVGLAALGTGLLSVQVNIFVSIGVVDLMKFYGCHLARFILNSFTAQQRLGFLLR